jgi:hypothetical protein
MSTQSLVRFICDNDPTHNVMTPGPSPDGWIQMVPSWGDGSNKNFDTMTCATLWYESENPF